VNRRALVAETACCATRQRRQHSNLCESGRPCQQATHGARRTLGMTTTCKTSSRSSLPPVRHRLPQAPETSSSLQQAYDALRARIPFATQDRRLQHDIEVTAKLSARLRC